MREEGRVERLLAVMLQDAQRVIDHEVRAIEESDDKTEHLIGLGVAALAGGLGLASLVAGRQEIVLGWGFFAAIGAGGMLNLASLGMFLASYVGLKGNRAAIVGPSLEWLQEKSLQLGWNVQSHYLSLLSQDGLPAYSRSNLARLASAAKLRRHGLYLLSASVAGYTGAFLLILANDIRSQA